MNEFLRASGECASILQDMDWTSHPLGDPSDWPAPLRMSLRIALNTQHPVFIFWGPELYCFYNDAYSRSIGSDRHPSILGQPGQEVWSEIWHIIGPQIAQVMRGDGSTWHENQLVPITRNGRREDVWWTYSYSPIDDPSTPSGVGGVLVLCQETTHQVTARQREAAEAERLREMFEQAPSFVCLLRGPDHRFEFANAAYMQLVGRSDLLGKTVREVLPEINGQGFYELLDHVFASGKRYVASRARALLNSSPEGEAEERFLNFVYEPMRTLQGDVSGILVEGHDVTEAVRTARLAEARLAEVETIYASAPLGLGLIDREMRFTRINEALADMNGFSTQEHLGRRVWDLVPALQATAEPLLKRVLAGETLTNVEISGETPKQPGQIRHWVEQFYPVRNQHGEVIAVGIICEEVTERKRNEEALRSSEAFLRHISDVAPSILYVYDLREKRNVWGNRDMSTVLGYARSDIDAMAGGLIESLMHPEDLKPYQSHLERIMSLPDGETAAFEYRFRNRDGAWAWLYSRDMVLHRDDEGVPT